MQNRSSNEPIRLCNWRQAGERNAIRGECNVSRVCVCVCARIGKAAFALLHSCVTCFNADCANVQHIIVWTALRRCANRRLQLMENREWESRWLNCRTLARLRREGTSARLRGYMRVFASILASFARQKDYERTARLHFLREKVCTWESSYSTPNRRALIIYGSLILNILNS